MPDDVSFQPLDWLKSYDRNQTPLANLQALDRSQNLPDIGSPAIPSGGQFSPGIPAVNRLADRWGSEHLGDIVAPKTLFRTASPLVNITDQDIERGIGVALSAGPGSIGKLEGGFPAAKAEIDRISPRLPTGKKSIEDPLASDRLQIDLDSMKQNPMLFEHNVNLVRDYPNLPHAERAGTADEIAENFIEHGKDNLLHLYDNIDPAVRERSKLWYEGGNKIANDFASDYSRYSNSTHPRASAAAIAALSPQKDWFMNVDLARRVHDIHYTKRGVPYSPEMEATAQQIYGDKEFAKENPGQTQIDPDYAAGMERIRGKQYRELEHDTDKAMWLRLYDEAHNDRSHRLVTPEGEFGDKVMTAKGEPSGTGWGSLGEIAKSIGALESGGDVAKISGLMGERHKVRSFYNNLIDPHSLHGDVTMDTHAVAAALMRPLSGNSLEVAHNFNNYPGKGLPTAKGSAVTGVQGTYPLYAEAYRRAAQERQVLPREMQSITWEGIRSLFPDTFKTKKNVAAVDNIWHQYRDGSISLDDARSQIFDLAGASHGIRPPDWHGQ